MGFECLNQLEDGGEVIEISRRQTRKSAGLMRRLGFIIVCVSSVDIHRSLVFFGHLRT